MARRSVLARALAVLVVCGGTGLVAVDQGSAAPAVPTLGLRGVLSHVDAERSPEDTGLYLTPGVYAQAVNGAFEIDVAKIGNTVSLWQVRRDSAGAHRIRQITPTGKVTLGNGLPGFLVINVTDSHGLVVSHSVQDWCPSATSRVAPTGPANTVYPYECGSDLTQAMPWGIDQGWASELFPNVPFRTSLPDGSGYHLTIAIAGAYARQLQIPSTAASVTMSLTVTTSTGGCVPLCPPVPVPDARRAHPHGGYGASPFATTSTQAGVPDMRALPAHDLSIESDSGHDYLDFAATIWNGGNGPLWLEGFRTGATNVMPVTQFFYSDDVLVGQRASGQFVYDNRPNHQWWDMPDIAQYDLLNSAGTQIVQSQKQSFCLGATDPINLSLPDADWQPGQYDSSTCGGTDAAWIREALDAGWGDTYYQSAACQAFDITALPNGTYQIRVTTDPSHVIAETSYTNNTALLKVRLGGTPGHRTVTPL